MRRNTLRRAAASGLMGCLVLLLSGCPLFDQVVYFPDPALDSAVRSALDRPFGFLTRGDVLKLRELDAAALNIQSLEGLEHCLYLTHLDLRSNNVVSIRELSYLHDLRSVDLGDNAVRDIEPLSGLLFLEFVNLFGDNQEVWDFTPLVANANATDSSLPGGMVVLPTRTTLNSDGTLQESFLPIYEQLTARGVEVIIAEADQTEVPL